jgi:hypothetical protein
MKNNYFFSGFTRHLFCWLSMLLMGLIAPTGLMAQTTLSAGDIAFVGFNGVDDGGTGNNSNDKFSFVLLKNVAANTKIFFTDFGWLTGGGFQTVSPTAGVGSKDDGIISWTASTSLAAGTQVVILCKYNLSASTGTVAGVEQVPAQSFYMNIGDPGADNIFAYQAATARDANPTLLAGIRTAGVQTTWDATLSNTEFTPAKTTLPAALTANGVNAALYLKGSFYTIAIYKCTLNNGFPKSLRNAINNPANWEYPNPGTPCEGYIYGPNDPDCPQSSIPTGYNLPINCTFTIAQVQIASQPVSKTVCAGQPVSFTSTASNATAYQWQVSTNGGGSFSNLSNGGVYTGATSNTLSISNTTGLNGYQYRLIASESTEPSSATSSAATLTVNAVPTLTLNGSANPTTCGGTNGSISFTTNLTNGSYSLSYTGTGSPKTVTVAGNAFTLTGLGAGSYSNFSITNSGCMGSLATPVNLTDPTPPTAGLLNNGPLSCSMTSVTLTASGGGTYQFSAGATQIGSTNQATVTTAGPYSVTVTGTNGCTATATTTVTGDQSVPTAGLLNNGPLSCSMTTVTLTASGGGTYQFSAGATQINGGNTASVSTAGPYSVTATSASGCTAVATTTVTGDQTVPTAGLLNNGPLSCSMTTVTLTASGGGTYQFSAGATQIGSTNQATVSTAGPYSVTVTGTNGCTATATTTVTGDQSVPTAGLLNNGPLSCSMTTVTLTASGGGTYQFSAGATQINGGNTATVTTAGPYSVTVTGTNGCSATATTTVTGDQSVPTAGLLNNGPLSCSMTTVTLTASGGGTYQFSAGATQINGGNTASVSTAGPYSVTATSASGCTATATTTVAGNQTVPTAGLTNDGPLSCSKTSVTLTASGGGTYQFSAGATQINGGNTATVTTAGPYSVTVTGTNGCSATATTTVTGDQSVPTAGLLNNGPLSCSMTTVTLTASGGGTYTFSAGATQIGSTNQASVTTAGPYSVTVTGTNGCTATATTTVTGDQSVPMVSISANPSLTITQGETTTLTANVSGGTPPFGYGWSTGASSNSITASTDEPYSVTVTGTNGCSATASVTVTVIQPSGPFAITGVTTLSCETISAGQRRVSFNPRYASLDGSPVSFSVVNELVPTTNPGPYTLNLYTDNPVITLSATQSGATNRFAYNWLSACSSSTANTPPTVVNPVSPQSATVGIGYTLSLANVFTDAETPNGQTLSVTGLPAGLNFVAPSTISGTPSMSGVGNVTVTATDPGGLMANNTFNITVNPAGGTPPPPSGTFSITGVTTISCQVLSAGERRLSFNPRYAGLNGAPVSFSVVNELLPTTAPGPYTLNLYTDNSVVTLRAVQSGISSSFAYNWLTACSSSTANTPPTVVNPVSLQSATVGVGYTLSLANVFTDAETPNQLTLSMSGLPAGLSFSPPSTISGTPSMSGVSNVTVTATDPGSLSASTSFTITVNPAGGTPPPTATFSITGVTTVSCEVISAGERRLTFNPRYADLDGSPVSFSVVNELSATTNPGPYTLNLYTDNPVINLRAVQSGVSTSFSYGWLAACNASARTAAEQVPLLQVRLLGNPVVGKTIRVEIQGAESQTVWLRVQNLSGGLVDEQVIRRAASTETVELATGTEGGIYLLHVSTGNQQRTLKVIKP